MSCPQCQSTSASGFCPHILLSVDRTYLTPSNGAYSFEPVDLQPVVVEAETDTALQLDLSTKSLIYMGERSITSAGSPDAITILSIANLIRLQQLSDVNENAPSTGDLLIFDELTQQWGPYTIPTGVPISDVGIDDTGALVKADPSAGSDTSASVPIGGMIFWTGQFDTIPAGFLQANGNEISRSVYASYFNIVGTTYGGGNGTTTFNIPNMNGRTAVGRDDTQVEFADIGDAGGEKSHTLTYDEMPNHAHGVFDPGHAHQANVNAVFLSSSTVSLYRTGASNATNQVTFGNYSTGVSGSNIGIYPAGNSRPHNNLQPFLTMFYIVRVI